eukprot:IDg2687t1
MPPFGAWDSAPALRLGVHRTPLEVFTGHLPVRPLLRAMPAAQHHTARTAEELHARRLVNIDATQKALAEMHSEVSGLISASRHRQVTAHNKRTNVHSANFCTGDFVLVRHAVGGRHKLAFVWTGPHRVANAKSDHVFVIENLISGKREAVHARRLQLYRADMDGKPVTQQLLRAISRTETRYETVNALRGIRADGASINIQVEWDGLPDEVDHT